MGLFDQLSNLSPDQSQGLLGMAAALLQAGGPSRVPVGFGQALGSGLQGFQQGVNESEQRRYLREQQALQSRLLGFKVKDAESDLANQAAQRERNARLDLFYRNRAGAPGTIPAGFADLAPTVENAEKLSAARAAAGGAPDLFNQRLVEAQELRSQGFGPEADAAEAAALKFREEFDPTPRVAVGADGRPFSYVLGKGGTVRRLDGVLPRDEMKLANLGGRDVAYNPFALQAGQSFTRTATPDALLSAATARRGQDMTDSRQRDANEIARGEKQKAADQAKAGQVASFDTMLGTLDRLEQHPGLARSVGLYSRTPTVPGTDSANFQAELETFKSQAFLPMVSQLKGMGALSDAEGKKLTAAVGALDPRMGEAAFRASLARVKKDMDDARERVAGARRSTPRSVVKTGTYGGRKVVKYSDGSIEYAD